MSKGELRSLYIAKDDEYLLGKSLLDQREPSLEKIEIEGIRFDSAEYFFKANSSTRLPVDVLVDVAESNHRLEKLILSPPYGAGPDTVLAATYIQEFFHHHAFTLDSIGEQSFTFPPGHPVSRTFYKQHPLASYRPEKRNYFIPSSMYDAILFAEREAELIGILVDLGATKIRIFKSSSKSGHANIAVAGKVGMSATEVAAKFKAMSASEQESFDNRELELDGFNWHQGDTLDRSKYGWLHFEPDWEALVKAREVGHCRTAEIELFKRTSFHTDSESAIKLRKHFAKAEVSIAQASSGSEVDRKLIQVEFGPALPPKKKSWLAKLTG